MKFIIPSRFIMKLRKKNYEIYNSDLLLTYSIPFKESPQPHEA